MKDSDRKRLEEGMTDTNGRVIRTIVDRMDAGEAAGSIAADYNLPEYIVIAIRNLIGMIDSLEQSRKALEEELAEVNRQLVKKLLGEIRLKEGSSNE